jgi:hypothetical protein
MMKATIKTTGETVTGRTLKEIKRKMNGMLSVDGARGLTASVDTGAEIHVELYEGQDYMITANGRFIN